MTAQPLLQSNVEGYPCRHGKVRDVYDLGDRLVIVATDRISAFDWVLPTGIPGKGKVLTQLSLFWFDFLNVQNHLISAEVSDLPKEFTPHQDALQGRTMLVQKTKVVPVECVVRGYIVGSGWKEYQQKGSVCGIKLSAGLQQAQQLDEPIFTPTTKAESGHDMPMTWDEVVQTIGSDVAEEVRDKSLDIYRRAAEFARERGIIMADTKFEWGRLPSGEIILIDEVLTPDSSRFWPADQYKVGTSPVSFDKQFVRDWLETTDWDKNSTPPELPDNIVEKTQQKYQEAYDRLTA